MKNHCVFDNLTLFKYHVGLQQKVRTMTEDGTMSDDCFILFSKVDLRCTFTQRFTHKKKEGEKRWEVRKKDVG